MKGVANRMKGVANRMKGVANRVKGVANRVKGVPPHFNPGWIFSTNFSNRIEIPFVTTICLR
jgi:hypothetical protein